ncbi:MAG: 3-oxoacyl-[acyl-carrier-protein] synthase 3 [Alphaproteobacteria bacterium MarineAlpha9_Bin3]|nr:MAG: 3-oxoacyl-[acyl-carrier-protein] synthase 3 [Alphaproteobacteria bacterium MarineAlpha9_Bin3]
MQITDIEYVLGNKKESLEDLGKINPDWIIDKLKDKTGIHSRHVLDVNENEKSLVISATKKLISRVQTDDIDGIIHVSQSPFSRLPTSACLIQDILGLPKKMMAFDLIQGCSGFVYGLSAASSMIYQQGLKRVIVICADTYTNYIDKQDRTNRPIFSDGAAAALIENKGDGSIGPFAFFTDGSGGDLLALEENEGKEKLFMDGQKVFKFSLREVPKVFNDLLDKADLEKSDIDLFIFHQASAVILRQLKFKLEIPDDKWFQNIKNIGNTVSATIPIAIKQSIDRGLYKPNMKIMLIGFGVGLSIAGCIIRS